MVSAEIGEIENLRESYRNVGKEDEFVVGLESSQDFARGEEKKTGVKLAGVMIILVRSPGMMHIRSVNVGQAAVDIRKRRLQDSNWVAKLKVTATGRKGKKVKV